MGPSHGKDMPACTFSPVSPRVSPILSSSLFPRVSLSTASGTDKMALTGPPPTMSDSTVPLARRSSSLALVSRPAASCSGTATKKRVTGSWGLGHSTPSPFPRAITTFGTEPPSNTSWTTEITTAATGKWTATSGNPSRCPILMSSNSGTRPGIPNLITGTSTSAKKSSNPLTTKRHKKPEPKTVASDFRQERHQPRLSPSEELMRAFPLHKDTFFITSFSQVHTCDSVFNPLICFRYVYLISCYFYLSYRLFYRIETLVFIMILYSWISTDNKR